MKITFDRRHLILIIIHNVYFSARYKHFNQFITKLKDVINNPGWKFKPYRIYLNMEYWSKYVKLC